MKLLGLGGDTSCARGLQGAHWNLLEEFHRHWDRIDYICPPHPEARPVTLFGNVHIHPLPPGRLRRRHHLVETGRHLLREHRHDVIGAHEYFPFHHGAAARTLSRITGIPHILEIYHVEGYPRPADLGERLRCWATGLYVARAARDAAAVRVINARQVPAWLVRHGVPEEKLLLLYSSYTDLDLFTPPPLDAVKDIDVLFVGRLVRNKGLHQLVAALAAMDPVPQTLLVGTGPLMDSLRQEIASRGLADRIRLHGWARDAAEIAALLKRSRLLACTSLSEGGPRTTLEAMACAVPVVTTPVGTMPDLIVPRENGCLAGFDAVSLRREMAWLLEDPQRAAAVGRRGREAVLPFERKALIRTYAEGYQSLARAQKKPS